MRTVRFLEPRRQEYMASGNCSREGNSREEGLLLRKRQAGKKTLKRAGKKSISLFEQKKTVRRRGRKAERDSLLKDKNKRRRAQGNDQSCHSEKGNVSAQGKLFKLGHEEWGAQTVVRNYKRPP